VYAGTLTENRMTVVEGWFAGVKYSTPPRKEQLPIDVGEEIINNICLNSKAFYVEEEGKKIEYVGNRTDCALLQLCEKEFGVPYDGVRKENKDKIVQVCPCDSRISCW
jgi:P-type Ca2+ transporter type 2C